MAVPLRKPPRLPGFGAFTPVSGGGGRPAGSQTWFASATKPKPIAYKPRSVQPYGGPAPGEDYGQGALYGPGGYQGRPNPVDMGTFFTGGGGTQYGSGAQQALRNPYRDMIGGDWDVQGAESAMNAGMGAARGNFTAQIRQALIDLGVTDTSKLGSLGSYIDADTISKAAQNKYSQTAQISQAETSKRAQTEAALAARGMLSSGQLTKSTEDVIAEGEGARYGALRDFLGAGQEGLGNLAQLNSQYASQLAQARFAAAQRAADLYNSALMWDFENQQGQYAPPPVPGTADAYSGPNAQDISRMIAQRWRPGRY